MIAILRRAVLRKVELWRTKVRIAKLMRGEWC